MLLLLKQVILPAKSFSFPQQDISSPLSVTKSDRKRAVQREETPQAHTEGHNGIGTRKVSTIPVFG